MPGSKPLLNIKGGLRPHVAMNMIEIGENKLGLNWAKLSSNWKWALLELRFAKFH